MRINGAKNNILRVIYLNFHINCFLCLPKLFDYLFLVWFIAFYFLKMLIFNYKYELNIYPTILMVLYIYFITQRSMTTSIQEHAIKYLNIRLEIGKNQSIPRTLWSECVWCWTVPIAHPRDSLIESFWNALYLISNNLIQLVCVGRMV